MDFTDDPNEPVRDPMQESYWTLAMMTAWVLWRTPQQVSEYWHINFKRHGFINAQSMNDVLGVAEYQERDQSRLGGSTDWPPLKLGAKKAVIEIRQSLAVLADGYLPSGNSRVSITSRDAENLAIGAHADPDQSLPAKSKWHDAVFVTHTAEPSFVGVRVARSDVLKLWPDPGTINIVKNDVTDLMNPAPESAAVFHDEKTNDIDQKAKAAARTALARQKRTLHAKTRLEVLRPHVELLATPKGTAEFRKLSDMFQIKRGLKPLKKGAFNKDISALRKSTEREVISVNNNRDDRTTEIASSHIRD